MFLVDAIKLDDLTTYASFDAVPLAAIIQTNIGDKPCIAFKTRTAGTVRPVGVAIVVTKDNCGEMISEEDIQSPCVDISNLVDIVACDPGSDALSPPLQRGTLLQNPIDRVCFLYGLFASKNGRPALEGWVVIKSDNPNIPIGSFYIEINNVGHLLAIAQCVDVVAR